MNDNNNTNKQITQNILVLTIAQHNVMTPGLDDSGSLFWLLASSRSSECASSSEDTCI